MAVAPAITVALARAVTATVPLAPAIAITLAAAVAITVALSDYNDMHQQSIPGMGLWRESVFAVILSLAVTITHTQSVADAIAFTITGTDATSDPRTGASWDQLSRRAGDVIQEDLH